MSFRSLLISTQVFGLCACVTVLAACGGGGGGSAPQNTATVAPLQSPMTAVQKEIAALPLAQAAPMPKGLHCKGDVVWVNLSKKTYHREGDPYYGRTKHGEYMCEAAADAAGYHLAGSHHSSSSSGSMNGMNGMNDMSNSSSSQDTSESGASSGTTSKKHHHRSSSSGG